MLNSRALAALNNKLKCQLFNIRAFSTNNINFESSSSGQKQESNEPQQQIRKLGTWVAIALTAGAATYYFWSYNRTKERWMTITAATRIRDDLPNFSKNDVSDRRFYTYGVGVYDLKDYAKNEHPGGEKSITDSVGQHFEKVWSQNGIEFHENEENLELLEGMRVGNVEGAMDRVESRYKPPKVGEGPLCLVPEVDAKEYRLELKIDGEKNLKSLTLEELRKYPKQSIITKSKVEATWTGVQLRDILQEFKINEADYDQIRFECLDTSSTVDKPYSLTVSRRQVLTDPNFDVLLAYEKDGSDISPQHGYPVRVIMPQAADVRNFKWLHRVVLVKKNI